MPALLDDPASATIYRTSGAEPFPDPLDPQASIPFDLVPKQVTLRDRVTVATIVPFSSPSQVPPSLIAYLSDQLNKEIEIGNTYPMINGLTYEQFAAHWFGNFGAVILLGDIGSADQVSGDKHWETECLGSFYIKPNYPGRSSHVSNGGFLVTTAARNKGVGRLLGEAYLEWAPKLGYVYSVFNLVYETNVASCRIWDALGFKRIGRVKGAGNLKSYPGQLVDAIIYGRDLGPEGEDFVSEERFDKIKFYLKTGKYPAGADRAEKSRLRSAATHYKLVPENDKLMLKDKEVISDPQRQYEIARSVHVGQHGGINKTTATIAEKYHWVRIKETVSLVIRNCTQCKELGKSPSVRAPDTNVIRPPRNNSPAHTASPGRNISLHQQAPRQTISNNFKIHRGPSQNNTFKLHQQAQQDSTFKAGQGSVSPQVLNRTLPGSSQPTPTSHPQHLHGHQHEYHPPMQLQHQQQPAPIARMRDDDYIPLDPRMLMDDVRHSLSSYNDPPHHDNSYHVEEDQDSFQDMLNHSKAGNHGGGGNGGGADGDNDGMGDELDMLIDQDGVGDHGEGRYEDDGDGDGGGDEAVMQLRGGTRDAEMGGLGRGHGSGFGGGGG